MRPVIRTRAGIQKWLSVRMAFHIEDERKSISCFSRMGMEAAIVLNEITASDTCFGKLQFSAQVRRSLRLADELDSTPRGMVGAITTA